MGRFWKLWCWRFSLPSANKEGLPCDTSENHIWWDISIDNSEESANIENAPTELVQYEERSNLVEKGYINNIPDDLLEVFLHS